MATLMDDEEVIMFMRRYDRDGDAMLSYTEFEQLILP